MKEVVLICPSNMLFMPYVENYEKILKENNIEYDIINWDRFHYEDVNYGLTYRDSKIGHKRNFFDYYKYTKFIINHLNKAQYKKVIIFGIQLTFFLKNFLKKRFRYKYILDIRDYNKIVNYFNFKNIIDNSAFTVISSPAYKEWLPNCEKYIVNHNIKTLNLENLNKVNIIDIEDKINISFIGATRDYQINIDLINSLKNSKKINIYFHGLGDVNSKIQEFIRSNNIKNVYLTGIYNKEEEENLYEKSHFINVLRYNDSINNKTALPNRLYKAVFYGKPLLGFKGTYLSEIIKVYNLGLVIDSFDNLEKKIINFLDNFDINLYYKGRIAFLKKVINDNNKFKNRLKNFLTH